MMNRRQALKKMFTTVVAGLLYPLMPKEEPIRSWAAARPKKVDKKTALYHSHPEDGKMCMNCQHFIPPEGMSPMMEGRGQSMREMNGAMGMGNMMAGGCTLVAGPISPMGYCRFYMRKS
jgi:hypothetical protein